MNALTVVSIGVAIATVTDVQFSVFGACVAMAWIIPSVVNQILWCNMQQQENWTALSYVASSFEHTCNLFRNYGLKGMQSISLAQGNQWIERIIKSCVFLFKEERKIISIAYFAGRQFRSYSLY